MVNACEKHPHQIHLLWGRPAVIIDPATIIHPHALAPRVRAEARGGGGKRILGWHSRAISAYTWCVTKEGPQRRWLHRIGREEAPECHCGDSAQSGRHVVEGCGKLTELRRVLGQGLEDWETRHLRRRRKGERGDVGVKKEKE